ncbi:MAG: type II toxin-antitoxin system prevent-host-death family antitoxin [Chloroflexota bacterium]|nr:type II toxin-antitoxin system prevent-host-death family antitoxin [Chloroflexota bacterium]
MGGEDMREIQATEAKTRLAQLLRDVEDGETIAITRHGKAIAHLVPAQEREQADRDAAVDRLLQRRAGWAPTGMSRDELMAARHEGHRV